MCDHPVVNQDNVCIACGESIEMEDYVDHIQEQFEAFHATHPHVYRAFVDLAREGRRAGLKKLGAKALWEVLRWDMTVRASDPAGVKLNNNYTSRYARLVMDTESDLDEAFELRTLAAEK